jgi:putative SOS response-associated peptidase YedK
MRSISTLTRLIAKVVSAIIRLKLSRTMMPTSRSLPRRRRAKLLPASIGCDRPLYQPSFFGRGQNLSGSLPIVRFDARAGERCLDLARWGLVPYWAKDIKVGFANINAKAEGMENKPAFREAFQRRRCLVPVDNFFEWKKTAIGKQPYAVALADRELMALAAHLENWRSPAGEWMRSFAVVTCPPNELCAELHSRMPVVLGPETWPAWLGETPAKARQLKAMLVH